MHTKVPTHPAAARGAAPPAVAGTPYTSDTGWSDASLAAAAAAAASQGDCDSLDDDGGQAAEADAAAAAAAAAEDANASPSSPPPSPMPPTPVGGGAGGGDGGGVGVGGGGGGGILAALARRSPARKAELNADIAGFHEQDAARRQSAGNPPSLRRSPRRPTPRKGSGLPPRRRCPVGTRGGLWGRRLRRADVAASAAAPCAVRGHRERPCCDFPASWPSLQPRLRMLACTGRYLVVFVQWVMRR